MKKAVLLDVSAIMYRAFYAHMNFRTKGEPTGAIFGFTNTLLAIIDEFKPDYIGAAFDVKRSTLKRSEKYEGYKADRKPMPDDLRAQVPRIEELLDAFGIEKFKVEGNEADDVLGTLAKRYSEKGVEVFVVTGDKDLSQVLDENINIALLGKGEGKSRFKVSETDEDVKEQLGVYPKDIPDLFGLIGDSSDGIPGVRKVGVKKAIPMLETYGNLEGIYENIDKLVELPGVGKGLVKNIEEDKELAFLSRELAVIDTNLDIDLDTCSMDYAIKKESLYELFKTLEFRVLIKKLELNPVKEEIQVKKSKELEGKKDENQGQLGLFGGTSVIEELVKEDTEIKEKEVDKRVLLKDKLDSLDIDALTDESVDKLLEVIEGLKYKKLENKDSSFERIEITDVYRNDIVVKCLEDFEDLMEAAKKEGLASIIYSGYGFAVSLKESNHYIPVAHKGLGSFNISKEELAEFFGDSRIKFISYKFKEILRAGYEVENIYFDAMIAYYLLTSYTKEDVETLIYNETGNELPTYKEVFGKEKPELIDVERAKDYLVKRSRGVYDLFEDLQERLEEDGRLDTLYKEVEMPLMPILAKMEKNGIAIDPKYFLKYNGELNERLKELQEKIFEISEEEFNLNSPKQLGEILFMKLNIDTTGVKKTKTGYSTNVDVLEFLMDRGEKIAEYILDYRKLSKLNSTYVEALPKLIDNENRLHTTFNQTGTATGRLSSSNPNLQNIPVKTDEGIKIRQGFVAKEGYTLLALDYSQIELRVLAEISKDENLLKAYNEDLDLHDLTARKIFEIEEGKEVSREQRTMAKIVNFSIIYGKTPFGLAKELSITQKDAKEYITRYFEEYPRVKELEEEIVKSAEENGFVRTLYGRKRVVDGITAKNRNIKNQAERMAVNTVIQGTAADILKKVMIEVFKTIKDEKDISLSLQVHDELIFEVKDSSIEKYSKLIKKVMEESISLEDVNLKANVSYGKNWAKAK